jgi:hypothetical protein
VGLAGEQGFANFDCQELEGAQIIGLCITVSAPQVSDWKRWIVGGVGNVFGEPLVVFLGAW